MFNKLLHLFPRNMSDSRLLHNSVSVIDIVKQLWNLACFKRHLACLIPSVAADYPSFVCSHTPHSSLIAHIHVCKLNCNTHLYKSMHVHFSTLIFTRHQSMRTHRISPARLVGVGAVASVPQGAAASQRVLTLNDCNTVRRSKQHFPTYFHKSDPIVVKNENWKKRYPRKKTVAVACFGFLGNSGVDYIWKV